MLFEKDCNLIKWAFEFDSRNWEEVELIMALVVVLVLVVSRQ